MEKKSGFDFEPRASSHIYLDPDSPEERAAAHKALVRHRQEDLADMIGVHNPIPSHTS